MNRSNQCVGKQHREHGIKQRCSNCHRTELDRQVIETENVEIEVKFSLREEIGAGDTVSSDYFIYYS